MNNIILLICFSISFFVTLFATPSWIKRAKKHGLVGQDVHKLDKRKVAEMGGIAVILGFIFAILSYVALTINQPNTEKNTLMVLGILCSLLMTTVIGIIDDILGWKIGLRQYEKPILTLIATIPIAILLIGDNTLLLPFLGSVNIGIVYSVLLIPAIILITTNGFNMLAGYNGLEAGQGIIILGTLGAIAFKLGNFWPGTIAFIMVFGLAAFLIHNFYPAKVFPGDSLTYSVGALIGIVAIVGHLEMTLLILFIPYGIEFFLKMRGKFQKESFAKLHKDGSLYVTGIYGLEHVMVRIISKFKKVREYEVIISVWIIQLILGVITWMVFR
jgi:UDP-N-acetylglucosamine--dolichyl-phosphate N-acetylglucosaminephosphotransferase